MQPDREQLISELIVLMTDLFYENWSKVDVDDKLPCGMSVREACWRIRENLEP